MARLPEKEPVVFPKVQHDFSSLSISGAQPERLQEVRDAFVKTWRSYEKYAWGHDELQPISLKAHNPFGGWAATMIDSLDALWILDMKPEFYRAATFVAQIDFDNSTSDGCNLFETNIRHLGGLLSAYELSGENALLVKAVELGNMLYAAFDNDQHMPPHSVVLHDLKRGRATPEVRQSSASLGSFSMEFTRLSQLTGIPKFYDAIDRITRAFNSTQSSSRVPGLWPIRIDVLKNFDVSNSAFTLGAEADSLYEYLLKQHLLLKGTEPMYEKMYRDAMDATAANLIFRPQIPGKQDILMLGTTDVNSRGKVTRSSRVEHLGCFAGGMFAMGGKTFNIKKHVEIGEKLARGCAYAYSAFPTGLMPEVTYMDSCPSLDPCDPDPTSTSSPVGFQPRDKRYILRPEAIESIFYLYRITGNPEFRDIAWEMWKSIKNASETEKAFAAVHDVTSVKSRKGDSMESFWLAETLKYFWLVFADEDVLNLDEWVLNTEAHPFRRVSP